MTAPNGFLVDSNSTPLPRIGISVDPTTGAPTVQTVDGGGNPVATPVGGGGGGTPASGVSPKASGAGAVGTSTAYARQDHVHPVNDGVDIGLINSTQKTQIAASATVALLNAGKTAFKDPAGGADIPFGTVSTAWQTYTPSATNTVHIAIDRASGPNVLLNAPVDNTQVVDVPLNMNDGQEMQINLVGGGGSGNWTLWSSGAPTTPGYVFLTNGVAPVAPASSANYLRVLVKRRGYKYECDVVPFNANCVV